MNMNRLLTTLLISAATIILPATGKAQSIFDETLFDGETVNVEEIIEQEPETPAQRPVQRRLPRKKPEGLWALTDSDGNYLDPANFGPQELVVDSLLDLDGLTMPAPFFMPAVFDTYSLTKNAESYDPMTSPFPEAGSPTAWIDRRVARNSRLNAFMQDYMVANPGLVRYNMADLPRPPKEFTMEVDPATAKITVHEFVRDRKQMAEIAQAPEISRINWLHSFDGALQFSQAYVSPNWYQGGNSNLNMIVNALYNVKLNQAFHPNLIFETTVSYKLGLNNAPEDTVHNYNISEDLFQINTKFGVKAAKRWYYSVNGQFKTQLLNNFKTNSRELTAAFLSPSELNVGVGMTYAYTNKKNTFTFNASIAPLSYNLKTCTNSRLNPEAFGIKPGKHSVSQYGSNAELTWQWKLSYNITYNSRMFIFTDYNYVQGDWENTLAFDINRFLSTRLYAHLRYASNAVRDLESKWSKLQVKEILSIGFAYKFSRG